MKGVAMKSVNMYLRLFIAVLIGGFGGAFLAGYLGVVSKPLGVLIGGVAAFIFVAPVSFFLAIPKAFAWSWRETIAPMFVGIGQGFGRFWSRRHSFPMIIFGMIGLWMWSPLLYLYGAWFIGLPRGSGTNTVLAAFASMGFLFFGLIGIAVFVLIPMLMIGFLFSKNQEHTDDTVDVCWDIMTKINPIGFVIWSLIKLIPMTPKLIPLTGKALVFLVGLIIVALLFVFYSIYYLIKLTYSQWRLAALIHGAVGVVIALSFGKDLLSLGVGALTGAVIAVTNTVLAKLLVKRIERKIGYLLWA